MSNPLRSFRKHQKKLIVFFGIMLMFAFIVVPSIIQNMQSEQGGGYANPTVATWKHGEIKREDLRRMALERAVAREFLSDLDAQAHPDAHPFFRGRGFESKVQLIGGFQHEQSGLGSFGNQALVLTMLLAEKAKDLGFVVSDKAIVDYLSAVCEGTIDSSQFEPRFRDISNGRITYQQFVEHLRTELLALNMQTIIANGSVNLLPVDVLDANMRMNRMVRAEVIPIDVSEYVAKVTGEPSDSELQALYEEGKDRYPHADYAEPGFRRIYATVVEYFKADRDAVIEKEMLKVTDKEIQEYYDKHKDADFRETALPIGPQDERNSFPSGIPGHGGFDFPGGAFPGGNLPSGFPGSDFPGGNLPRDFPGGGLPGGSPFPSGFDFPPTGSGNDTDSAPKSDSAPNNDGEGGVSEPQTTQESNEPEATDGALNALPRGEYFVSLLEDDEPGTAPAGDAKAPDATESGDSPKTESQPAEPAPKPEKKVEYRPLKEVEAEIRRTIATQRADAKINDSTSQVERTLDRYFRDAARWKSRNSDDDDGDDDSGVLTPADLAAYARQPGVTPIDYQKIADEHGLVFGRTEDEAGNPKPLDFFSFDDHELGKSDTIKQVMLNPDLAPYVVKKTSDSSNPRFVYWKTQVVKEHLPALSEIRDEVVAAWRLAEARKLAEQKAKEMAEDARQSGKSLHERFGASVKETNYFTWMSTGGGNLPQGGGGMEVSKVNNVETPGDEFMKPVFDLREGEIGVAFNQPQSMVYVVRIANETQTPDELREDFLKRGAAVLTNVGQVMTSERQQFQVDWFDDLEKEMELEWLPQEPDDGQ